MQAVILCGGEGKRLAPLTKKIPKPMVVINNKPFLEHQIIYLRNQGINDFVFCVGYKWNYIFNYFGDGSRLKVKINYSVEKNLIGTGGAIKLAKNYLEHYFLVIYGDSFLPINYKSFYKNAK